MVLFLPKCEIIKNLSSILKYIFLNLVSKPKLRFRYVLIFILYINVYMHIYYILMYICIMHIYYIYKGFKYTIYYAIEIYRYIGEREKI